MFVVIFLADRQTWCSDIEKVNTVRSERFFLKFLLGLKATESSHTIFCASSEFFLHTQSSTLTWEWSIQNPSNACMAILSGHVILYPKRLRAFLKLCFFMCIALTPWTNC